MAEIQSGTKFAAIAPSVDVDRRSALVNTKSLEYTIEDIAAAVGGDVDLTDYLKIVDAAATYQPLSGMSSYLTTANAASTYQPISGMSSYLTTANAATTYQTLLGMSSYLTTSNAAAIYQQKFNIADDDTLFINSNVLSGSYVDAFGVSVAPGKSSGTVYLQINTPYTWTDNGTVYFYVSCSYASVTSKILLTCTSNSYNHIAFATVYNQTPGQFYVSVRNMGFAIYDNYIGVNWTVIK